MSEQRIPSEEIDGKLYVLYLHALPTYGKDRVDESDIIVLGDLLDEIPDEGMFGCNFIEKDHYIIPVDSIKWEES